MTRATFADLIEAAEQLLIEEQEDLVHILKNRLRDRKRAELIKDVAEAQQEFAQGKCKPLNPEQIMEEILS
jgi:3-methyladenine DNA glycosylase/8-oxoguanine DNA glycosylase